jgi:hypothetical protein
MSEGRAVGFWWLRCSGKGWTVAEVWEAAEGKRVSMLDAAMSAPLEEIRSSSWGPYIGREPIELESAAALEAAAIMQRNVDLLHGLASALQVEAGAGALERMVQRARERAEENESLRAEVKRLKDAASLRWEYEVGL